MDNPESFSYQFKFLIIGGAGTGKTCLLRQYTEGKFFPNMPHTIGAEFGSKLTTVAGTSVKVQIWDTAGQERFRSVSRAYYQSAVGALLVYDITNRETFNTLLQWFNDAKQLASPDITIILVGNKKDLQESEGQVTHWEANAFAEEHSIDLLETSALTGENVEQAFETCIRSILSKIKTGEINSDAFRRHTPLLTGLTSDTNNPLPISAAQTPGVTTYQSECRC